MFKALIALTIFSAASGSAAAQTAPQPQAPAARQQMVKKTVCRRVDDEETTGSRLGSAPKVCKTIEVPAPGGAGNGDRAPSAASSAERG